ncbi:DUF2442 domain-containing protein [Persicitalea sp.]|uniref:DUF2442 domain-containing protein n=1 Tax=Persicitalea sp. TaxID=3100273 RepID=UPI003593F5E3
MLAHILDIKVLDDYEIKFEFNDGVCKIIDFKPFIKNDSLTKPLADMDYFEKVKLYDRGRGIYWDNGYDFCPDYLRELETVE